MERCLKKLVLDAQAMSFWDSGKGGWEPVGPSGRKTVLGGLDWGKRMYTCNHRRAIKLIPVDSLFTRSRRGVAVNKRRACHDES